MTGAIRASRASRTIRAIRTCSLLGVALLMGCSGQAPGSRSYDVILRGGTIVDGSGSEPFVGDVAIRGDRIVAVAPSVAGVGQREIDVRGLHVTPGFINVLSWATESLLVDGRGLSDIVQGVTLEVFGEGWSMGPLNAAMKQQVRAEQGDVKFEVDWTTLGEYLEGLERRGIAPNVASFVGATTVRIHELGFADRAPTEAELDRMRALVARAMEEGALGLGTSLIYAPAFYAETEELIALAQVAGDYGGMYISHLRSEGNRWEQAVDELIRIAREAELPAEIYHLKAAGRANWPKLEPMIQRIEEARAAGHAITADMYTYTAGATGLDAAMPPWVQEGGLTHWIARLQDPQTRERVAEEMRRDATDWENLYASAGSPERVLLAGFKSEALKPLTGKTLAEVAAMRGKSAEETAMDLVIEDGSRVETVYFLMSEENVARQVAIPWMSFGSDAAALAPEGAFLKSSAHPRAYGNFARLLGKYVRDEKRLSLQAAVRQLTTLPATNLKLTDRGTLRPGAYADLAVFDLAAISDPATFAAPHQLATGMRHVFVNGRAVLSDGVMTAERPGRVVRGPGFTGKR
jgi:N-acyl-D-amino-acid deacylase